MSVQPEACWVEVAYSPHAGEVVIKRLPLQGDEVLTVAQAIYSSGLLLDFPEIQAQSAMLSIYGRSCTAKQVLRARDRVEILRPLKVDPKQARRLRVAPKLKNKKSTSSL